MFKYFQYAIGEILLVTIGILMALQVNNCNERRKARNLEMETLRNIRQELRSDIALIDNFLAQYEKDKASVIGLYSLFGEDINRISQDSLSKLVIGTFLSLNLELNRSVYDEVVSAGRLSLVQNKELKSLILEWGSEIDRAKSREQWAEQFAREYVFPFTLDYFTWKDVDRFDPVMSTINTSGSKLSVDNRTILSSLRFENLIGNWIYNLETIKETYLNVREHARMTIAIIDNELDPDGP